jgi:hypothetical protein
LEKDLPKIHDLLLQDRVHEASELYNKSAQKIPDAIEREIKREREFVHILSESKQFGITESKYGTTPRQALVLAALSGWSGDSPCSWISPAAREDIIAWGGSHYGGPSSHLEVAFSALELEGLFFEVHPAVFYPAVYYCSFDPDFLQEIPDPGQYYVLWEAFVDEYDDEYGITWCHTGLCSGQGSQGPSDARWGPCLGSSCCWYKAGEKSCNHGLSFNRSVLRTEKDAQCD